MKRLNRLPLILLASVLLLVPIADAQQADSDDTPDDTQPAAAPTLGGESDPSNFRTEEEMQAHRDQLMFEYLDEHKWDDLNNAVFPWDPRAFYSDFLDSYGLGPGPIGRFSTHGNVYQAGARLKQISLPGLDLFYELSERGVGQSTKSVGNTQSAYFADYGGSGWGFDGRVPYIRMTYIVANESDTGPDCSLGGSCVCTSNCTYMRRGALHMGGEIYEFEQEGTEQTCFQQINIGCGSNAPPPGCGGEPTGCNSSLGAIRFRSNRGGMIFDLTNQSTPILYMPDGTKFIMNGSAISAWNNPTSYPYVGASFTDYGPSESISANGEVTTYAWVAAPAGGSVYQITDARGRVKTWDPGCGIFSQNGILCGPGNIPANSGGTFTSTWTVPGALGVPQTYTFNWSYTTYDPRTAFPELVNDPNLHNSTGSINFCVDVLNRTEDQCAARPVKTLNSIRLPDGRSYQFSYGPWVNLTQIQEPHGEVTQYTYGNPSNNVTTGNAYVTSYVSPVFGGSDNPDPPNLYWAGLLQSRVPITSTVFPNGLSGNSYSSSQSSACNGPPCTVFWTTITRPDGSIEKIAKSVGDNTMPIDVLGDELWSSDGKTLVSATYRGDTSTGKPYALAEIAGGAFNVKALSLNVRNTRTITQHDGLSVTHAFTYDSTSIPAKSTTSWDPTVPSTTTGATWSNGNVLTDTVKDSAGNVLMTTSTSYVTAASYTNQALSHLPTTISVKDATNTILSRKDYSYDDFALAPSSQPGLDTTYTTGFRGNLTTITAYATPATAGNPVVSKTYYFDNGVVQKTQTPNDVARGTYATTMTSFNFGACSSNPTVASTTTNALGHAVSTVNDCYTGKLYSTVDSNQQRTCAQTDWLGRDVETAGPGDLLTPLPTALSCNSCTVQSASLCGITCNTCNFCAFNPLCNNTDPRCGSCGTFTTAQSCSACGGVQNTCTVTNCSMCGVSSGGFVRDGGCGTNNGTAVGNGGNGPTTWTEYFPFGVNGVGYNQEHTVVHVKDGSATGHYTKKFSDGAGRVVESCTNIDPDTTSGAGANDEACTYTTYDNMGRVSQQYSPYFAKDVASASQPASGQYSQTSYDTIGRTTQSSFVWATGSLATNTSYSTLNGRWLTTVTNGNGNQTQSLSNLLGQVTELDQYRCTSSPCTPTTKGVTKLPTVLTYDVLGHLLTSTDPLGNVLQLNWDGLGRKTSMNDPDLGHWTYGYDGNGNLTSQTDAKSQTITMQYDALNRITLKDLPPTGPDLWDVVYDYDGYRRTSCYSCYDPVSGQTGFCNQVSGTCVLVAGEVGKVCTPNATQTCQNPVCDESCGNPHGCAGATMTCNAGGTEWGACSGGTCPAPPPASCSPGATQSCQNPVCDESCGNPSGCTGATQTCQPSGQWGNCTGGSCPCVNGSTRTIACGNCGLETDNCNAGQWVAGACLGQGDCAPNATRTVACGNCGQETDTCTASCQWSAGACTGQGVCAPNATQGCGNCGSQTCTSTCQWGTCGNQGVCTAGSTRSEACSDSFGDTGNETDTCSASCQWSSGACVVCTPGATQDCDNGLCSVCSGTCILGSQTCQSDGTWGSCVGEQCQNGGCPPPPMECF